MDPPPPPTAPPPQNEPRLVAIQLNPSSGSGSRRHLLLDLVRSLREMGFQPRVFKNRDRLEQWMQVPGHRTRLRCLVAAGGDGTVSDVINRFPGVRVAVLPLGTENLLSRFLKIPRSGPDVARIIADGHVTTMDLGIVGQRRFALMVSAGIDAEIVRRTHAARLGNISHLSYVKPILDSLRKYEYPEIQVRVDDAVIPLRGRMAMVFNVPAYALRLPVARSARCDDGLFDLRLFQRGSTFHMLRYFGSLVLGSHERLPHVLGATGRRIRLDSDVPVPIQVDGDPAGWTPVEIRVLAGALEICVPKG